MSKKVGDVIVDVLKEAGVRDLGVQTEMLTDGLIDLYEAGVVTGAWQVNWRQT